MKTKKILAGLLVALFLLAGCTPQEQQGMSDKDYYAEILKIEPKMTTEIALLPFMMIKFDSESSQADLNLFITSQRETWERVKEFDYQGKTFSSSHQLLLEMADLKLDWVQRMEEAIPQGVDATSLVLGEMVSHMGKYEGYDSELKRNEDTSEWTFDLNGEVIAKADIVEATDEELAVDERFVFLAKKANDFDPDIRVFLDEERENTIIFTYKEPADSRKKGTDYYTWLKRIARMYKEARVSGNNQRGDFRMFVEFKW